MRKAPDEALRAIQGCEPGNRKKKKDVRRHISTPESDRHRLVDRV